MKRSIYIIIMTLALTSNVMAQSQMLSKEDFRKRQKEYFIEKAQLKEDEAEQFYTLYCELQDKKHDLNKSMWMKLKEAKTEELSEEEYDMLSEDIIRTRIKSGQLDLAYFKKYKEFLSAKKIYQLQQAEISFRRGMIKAHKEKRNSKE